MSSKYQREIEEILENAGEVAAPRPRRPRDRSGLIRTIWLYFKQSITGSPFSISPGRVMLAGFLLLIATLIVSPFVAGPIGFLGWAGLLLFIIGYGMVLARPPKIEKRWRGQPVDDRSQSLLDKARRIFRRR